MRVLVVATDGRDLHEFLAQAGHEVIASLTTPSALLKTTEALLPDLIVVHTAAPGGALLEQLSILSRHAPRPVVVFTSDGARETIGKALAAGVSAYVVDGLAPGRVRTIIDVAVARFAHSQRLHSELAQARRHLAERKLVERAKGVVMKTQGLDEEAAYAFLRKAAMDRKQRLAEVAAELLVHEQSA